MDLLITYQLRRDHRPAITVDTKIIREIHMREESEIVELLEDMNEQIAADIVTEIEK